MKEKKKIILTNYNDSERIGVVASSIAELKSKGKEFFFLIFAI